MSQNYKEPVYGIFEDITDVIFQCLGGESSDLEIEDDSNESTMGPGMHRVVYRSTLLLLID